MLNIIKSDLYRIFRGKGIYIAIIFMFLMIEMSIFVMTPGFIGTTVMTDGETNQVMSQEDLALMEEVSKANNILDIREIMKEHATFNLDKQIIGANINLYYVFIVIVFIIICVDLSDSTAKNTLSSAISREKYYISKVCTVMIIGILITLLNNFGIYFLNIIFNGKSFSSDFMEFTKCTIIQFPVILGMLSILIGIAFITKKKSLFNGISIPLLIVVQLILQGAIAIFHLKSTIMTNWELQYMISNLANNPATEYIIKTILLGIFYVIIFNLLGYYSFKKTEIK